MCCHAQCARPSVACFVYCTARAHGTTRAHCSAAPTFQQLRLVAPIGCSDMQALCWWLRGKLQVYSLFPALAADLYGPKHVAATYGALYTGKAVASVLAGNSNWLLRLYWPVIVTGCCVCTGR